VPLILFDIDLTLIHTNGAGRAAMERALARYGVESPTAGIVFDGRTDRAIFADALERLGDHSPASFTRLVAEYLEHLPASLEAAGGTVLPGVGDLLAALDAAGEPAGLATGNLRRGAELKLGHYSLWDRFAAGGFGDDESIRARLVAAAITDLARVSGRGANAADAIVLGDTPLDVEAAHLAGARAVGVATGRYSVEQLRDAGAEWAVQDLRDTAAMLDILLERAPALPRS
jgi:phosphoglycolate phosphatase-like HAD superfamily hydrolase